MERKVADRERSLDEQLAKQRKEAAHTAAKLELPMDLFPAKEPYKYFPWEDHFGPRSVAEESLRIAHGLRDVHALRVELPRAAAAGLTMRNSRVYFQSSELYDLLAAEEMMVTHSASCARPNAEGVALAETSRPARTTAVSGTDEEPRSPLRRQSSSEGNVTSNGMPTTTGQPLAPPLLVREKTSDVWERLGAALDVFVEQVHTEVPAGLPQPRPFVDILSDRAASFADFVQGPADVGRRDAILKTVSGAVGVSDIETEQCREQEQEKAQEQEQEQEIEMERYVDMAYQRDNEEPHRWAFCTLGEFADGRRVSDASVANTADSDTDGRRLAPFASGAFYPAADFRLHGRQPLPFPPCVSLSRNHFNLDWSGERRLKNAVMALEYVPSVAALRRVPPSVQPLSETQRARLDDALRLLDMRGDERYGRSEVATLLHAVEHEDVDDITLDALMAGAGTAGGDATDGAPPTLGVEELRRVLTHGEQRRGDVGRHFVLLSLAEAETIRCLLHMRQGRPLIPGAEDMALALRCVPAHDVTFDATAHLPPSTAYQARVAHQCMRFLDSSMHYKPAELNVLVRSLPAPPASRRLFFSMVVACRRRLAKRWEQTPLARLFTLDDEWALLQLEALRVRMREAIHRRGLMLHDAFLFFDADDDGRLSLAEVLAALHWLGLASVAGADIVISFVRAFSREPHLTYGAFVELLAPPGKEDGGGEGKGVGDGEAGGPTVCAVADALASAHKLEPVTANAVAALESGWLAGVQRERETEAALEAEMAAQAERARRFVEEQLLESDFSWMRETRAAGGRNPRTTRTSCYYDFTRGVVGSQRGSPLWIEGRGRWTHVRAGSARVPAVRAYANSFLVLRVPFRKSGGGTYCNAWTVSAMIKLPTVSRRGLLSTAGWDQFSAAAEGDEAAQVMINDDGAIGAHGIYSAEGGSGAHIEAGRWCAISIAVDAVGAVVRTYVDGEEGVTIRSPKICKDGQWALRGRLALCFAHNPHNDWYAHQLSS